MNKILFALLISLPAYSGILEVVPDSYDFKSAPEYKAILVQLRDFGKFSNKESGPLPMTKGEQAIEEVKAKNRAIIAQKYQAEKEGKDKDSSLSQTELWREETKKTQEAWKNEVQDQLLQWKKDQEVFLGRLKIYKENTFEIPAKKEIIVEKKVENLPDAHIVHSAFNVAIKDQLGRPTCSAFAGIRAIELILAQNKKDYDLSEQYFYWASKPKCQTTPCSEKGSWVAHGIRYSQNVAQIDIPLEEKCSYRPSTDATNETQIPLIETCREGAAKVVGYEEVKTLAAVVEKLKKNIPVIMAAKLSENFYKNKGLVTVKESSSNPGAKLDGHALGHAFLAVGVMELPTLLQPEEGSYCIVIANSWGKGWGAGGYACLTEKWLLQYRQPSNFLAVSKISIK